MRRFGLWFEREFVTTDSPARFFVSAAVAGVLAVALIYGLREVLS